MREIQLRDAKSNLSSVIDDAIGGNPAIITRHGKAEAVILSFQEWQKLSNIPSFAQLLMAMPTDIELERDPSPLRQADF